MKKIILMYDFFSEHGGVERIMLFQAKALKKAGYDVSFAFAYVDENLRKERINEFDVLEYAKLPVKNETLQICSSIFRGGITEKFKDADLIICHSFPASYLALRIKKRFGVPYILHLHHPPQFLYNADLNWAKNSFKRKFSFMIGKILRMPLRKFDFYCVKNADDYFVECETVQRIIHQNYSVQGVVLYPSVNSVFKQIKIKQKEISNYGIKNDYILGSGRIIPQKRFDFLVNAFPYLKNNGNLQIVLAGKYEEKTKRELTQLAKDKKVPILFLGPLDAKELVKLYNCARAVVLTCPQEWFGLVPVESMACGCPVVAWKDNFGPQETVVEDINGFLAKPYEIKDLAKKIDGALDKKWNKKEIIKNVQKFSEREIEKILIKEINKFK